MKDINDAKNELSNHLKLFESIFPKTTVDRQEISKILVFLDTSQRTLISVKFADLFKNKLNIDMSGLILFTPDQEKISINQKITSIKDEILKNITILKMEKLSVKTETENPITKLENIEQENINTLLVIPTPYFASEFDEIPASLGLVSDISLENSKNPVFLVVNDHVNVPSKIEKIGIIVYNLKHFQKLYEDTNHLLDQNGELKFFIINMTEVLIKTGYFENLSKTEIEANIESFNTEAKIIFTQLQKDAEEISIRVNYSVISHDILENLRSEIKDFDPNFVTISLSTTENSILNQLKLGLIKKEDFNHGILVLKYTINNDENGQNETNKEID